MLDQRRVAAQPDENHERLFIERYKSLLAWALRLTNHDRESAEDLVQDAFVQFVLSRSRLEEIENIDGYLRRMLRYMHCSRISRSAQHLHETALSLADYDRFVSAGRQLNRRAACRLLKNCIRSVFMPAREKNRQKLVASSSCASFTTIFLLRLPVF